MKNKIIKISKHEMPEKLKNIKNSPETLYAIGNINLIYENNFAIVGTRKITPYGINNCRNFAKEFALRNIPIVSGMAIGTDTVAHKTTLEYGGKTIAVLGSGFNNIFPEKNLDLFYKIIENDGLILTEYDENVKPQKENFPQRNRLVTAISEGVLVIEAAYRSGTSITVRNAKEQGKKVFAIPGKLDSAVGVGVNRLIREGAILTTEIENILAHYPQFVTKERITVSENKVRIKKEFREIYYFLKIKSRFLEEILLQTGMELKNIVTILTEMELEGLIYQELSGRYKIKKE